MLSVVDGYTVLKLFHVLAAVVWVGGAVTANIYATRVVATKDGAQMIRSARETEWIGTHVYLPASLLVLLFGVLAVINGDIGFGHAWVILGLVGIAATATTGSTFLGPELKRIATLAEQRGAEDPEVVRRVTRVVRVARIDLVVLILVVVDMVLKPGG